MDIISKFLNVSIDKLLALPLDLLLAMQEAVKSDDFMLLHQLGYEVK